MTFTLMDNLAFTISEQFHYFFTRYLSHSTPSRIHHLYPFTVAHLQHQSSEVLPLPLMTQLAWILHAESDHDGVRTGPGRNWPITQDPLSLFRRTHAHSHTLARLLCSPIHLLMSGARFPFVYEPNMTILLLTVCQGVGKVPWYTTSPPFLFWAQQNGNQDTFGQTLTVVLCMDESIFKSRCHLMS